MAWKCGYFLKFSYNRSSTLFIIYAQLIMKDLQNQTKTHLSGTERIKVAVQLPPLSENLSCPLPNMVLWNMHPKVYLALDADNQAICPYCSTNYVVAHD